MNSVQISAGEVISWQIDRCSSVFLAALLVTYRGTDHKSFVPDHALVCVDETASLNNTIIIYWCYYWTNPFHRTHLTRYCQCYDKIYVHGTIISLQSPVSFLTLNKFWTNITWFHGIQYGYHAIRRHTSFVIFNFILLITPAWKHSQLFPKRGAQVLLDVKKWYCSSLSKIIEIVFVDYKKIGLVGSVFIYDIDT
jgi:hypothetical protein